MPPVDSQSSFPSGKALASLGAATLGLLAAAWVLMPNFFPAEEGVHDALLFAAALVATTSVLSLIPVMMLGRLGVMPTVYGYFGGMLVRVPLCFGGTIIVDRMEILPTMPLVVSLALFYLPLLMIEVSFVGNFLWNKDDHANPNGDDAKPAAEPSMEATT